MRNKKSSVADSVAGATSEPTTGSHVVNSSLAVTAAVFAIIITLLAVTFAALPLNEKPKWTEFKYAAFESRLAADEIALVYFFGPSHIAHAVMWPQLQNSQILSNVFMKAAVFPMSANIEDPAIDGFHVSLRAKRISTMIPQIVLFQGGNSPQPVVVLSGLIPSEHLETLVIQAIKHARGERDTIKFGSWSVAHGIRWNDGDE